MITVNWNDISSKISKLFKIWQFSDETEFAEEMWKVLEKEGLTNYTNNVEYNEVLIRILVLACIHHSFNNIAFEEGDCFSSLYYEWEDEFKPITLRLAQLAGKEFEKDALDDVEIDNENIDESDFRYRVVYYLCYENKDVALALTKNLDTQILLRKFYLSKGREIETEEVWDEDLEEYVEVENNDEDFWFSELDIKSSVYSWIESNMPLNLQESW
jgi:hypothetical protein